MFLSAIKLNHLLKQPQIPALPSLQIGLYQSITAKQTTHANTDQPKPNSNPHTHYNPNLILKIVNSIPIHFSHSPSHPKQSTHQMILPRLCRAHVSVRQP
jgi:hypothetical protein